ncbi:MAG: zinc metallopeptidase [Bacteroidales bacterium]|nr:zinc metallopeptidase [Bacteroidales bacterium]
MRLDGRRESSNVDDRRRAGGGTIAGVGLGGIVIVGLLTLLMGGNLGDVFNNVVQTTMQQGSVPSGGTGEFTEEEQQLATFSKQILAGTEDIWTAVFSKYGYKYRAPKMVLYTGTTSSGCGTANASVGPFYCSADECLYIDLNFFSSMKQQLGADGDFAYAYVIAHEVGHHVQHLLGTLDKAHQQMSRMSKAAANAVSVRIELQADYYAGVWGRNDNAKFGSLEAGDIDEAIRCASVIGDDYLQKKSQGYVVEESFTHGTAAQRKKWLTRGLNYGDLEHGDTFSIPESQL